MPVSICAQVGIANNPKLNRYDTKRIIKELVVEALKCLVTISYGRYIQTRPSSAA